MRLKIERYIKEWESKCYLNGLPDEVPSEISHLVPSYKIICMAILKNDYPLKSLGFSEPKSLVYSELKRFEISQRRTGQYIQLRLF